MPTKGESVWCLHLTLMAWRLIPTQRGENRCQLQKGTITSRIAASDMILWPHSKSQQSWYHGTITNQRHQTALKIDAETGCHEDNTGRDTWWVLCNLQITWYIDNISRDEVPGFDPLHSLVVLPDDFCDFWFIFFQGFDGAFCISFLWHKINLEQSDNWNSRALDQFGPHRDDWWSGEIVSIKAKSSESRTCF